MVAEDVQGRAFVHTIRDKHGKRALMPFFPRAFAKPSSPTDFDFENHVYDTLRLPCPLLPDHESPQHPLQPVTYKSVDELSEALQLWFGRYNEYRQQPAPGDESEGPIRERTKATEMASRRAMLDKEVIFHRSGRSLKGEGVETDVDILDANLSSVRVDRFDNVMIFTSPPWSEAAVQFCHGFPRALISAEHAGYTEGNIICTSKKSNSFVRAYAFRDIFSLASRSALSRTGLTELEFCHYRCLAVEQKHCLRRQSLLEAMFRLVFFLFNLNLQIKQNNYNI